MQCQVYVKRKYLFEENGHPSDGHMEGLGCLAPSMKRDSSSTMKHLIFRDAIDFHEG